MRETTPASTALIYAPQQAGVLLSCHPKSRTVRKKADQPTNPNRPGVRGVRDRPTDSVTKVGGCLTKKVLPPVSAMPTRISLRRVGSSTRKLMVLKPGFR